MDAFAFSQVKRWVRFLKSNGGNTHTKNKIVLTKLWESADQVHTRTQPLLLPLLLPVAK